MNRQIILDYATEKHLGQKRKNSGLDYITTTLKAINASLKEHSTIQERREYLWRVAKLYDSLLENLSEWRKNLQENDIVFYSECDEGNNHEAAEDRWGNYSKSIVDAMKDRPGQCSFEDVKNEVFLCSKTCLVSVITRTALGLLLHNKNNINEVFYLIREL